MAIKVSVHAKETGTIMSDVASLGHDLTVLRVHDGDYNGVEFFLPGAAIDKARQISSLFEQINALIPRRQDSEAA